jgi:hypothetical protein
MSSPGIPTSPFFWNEKDNGNSMLHSEVGVLIKKFPGSAIAAPVGNFIGATPYPNSISYIYNHTQRTRSELYAA